MSDKLLKQVESLAKTLMACAERDDEKSFHKAYEELKTLCDLHPDSLVAWETLADFTEDFELAISLYEGVLEKAEATESRDYVSSVSYSLAQLFFELGKKDDALRCIDKAKGSSKGSPDKQLISDIAELETVLLSN